MIMRDKECRNRITSSSNTTAEQWQINKQSVRRVDKAAMSIICIRYPMKQTINEIDPMTVFPSNLELSTVG